MLTTLGVDLSFDTITVEIICSENIKIVRQYFGFDPANGVYSVALDPDVPHYYIEVQSSSK